MDLIWLNGAFFILYSIGHGLISSLYINYTKRYDALINTITLLNLIMEHPKQL